MRPGLGLYLATRAAYVDIEVCGGRTKMPDVCLDIIPRDLRFGLIENADAAWFDGDPLKSAIMDGFAVLLPVGERFFIRSLRHYIGQIDDPVVRQDIQGYAVQEAFHTREHEAYNQALRNLGYDVDAMEAEVRALLDTDAAPFQRLLVTCAIEQITYAFARLLLSRPGLLRDSRPAYRRLWTWHALEELEHSAVSLRVLRAVTPNLPGWKRYLARVSLMSVVLVSFALPHRQSKAWSFLLQAPLGFGIGVGLVFLGSSLELSLVTLFAVFLATALSGRDLTDKPIGRWAAASFLLPVIALPVLDFVKGPAVSVLAALIVLLFSDQLVRRTPLHIPSLDTSYGFYGSFQLVTWLGLVTAAPLGVEVVQRLIVPNSDFTPLELALVFGLVVGFIFALLRILVIRSQDREIRNVEIRNMNLDNLLGL
jgi:predicted metal-dependent hydrolase